MSPESSEFQRFFFALWPPPAVVSNLAQARDAAHAEIGGRPMASESLHCTLAFLGRIEARQLEDVLAAAERVRGDAFNLDFSTLDFWPHNRIVWSGTGSTEPALFELAASLRDALLGTIPIPVFSTPHITLIRDAERAPSLHDFATVPWHCNEFVLARSKKKDASGARYELIARWPLAGGGE